MGIRILIQILFVFFKYKTVQVAIYSEVSTAKGNARKVVTMLSGFLKSYVPSAFAQLLQREKALGRRERGVLCTGEVLTAQEKNR